MQTQKLETLGLQLKNAIILRKNLLRTLDGMNLGLNPENSVSDTLTGIYTRTETQYPKFHKMDIPAKVAFLAASFLLETQDWSNLYNPYKCGIILSTSYGSLDSDIKHQTQIQMGFPSPAIFVYTLANIMAGEICIRYGFKGENTVVVSDEYNWEHQLEYIALCHDEGKMDLCIGGHVDAIDDTFNATMYLLTKNNQMEHLKTPLSQITNQLITFYV